MRDIPDVHGGMLLCLLAMIGNPFKAGSTQLYRLEWLVVPYCSKRRCVRPYLDEKGIAFIGQPPNEAKTNGAVRKGESEHECQS